MTRISMPLLATLFIVFAPGCGDAILGDIMAAQQAFSLVKSFHYETRNCDGSWSTVDIMMPDRIHVKQSNGIEYIIIGTDSWENVRGVWFSGPVGEATQEYAGETDAKSAIALHGGGGTPFFEGDLRAYTISDLGATTLDGMPTRHYRLSASVSRLYPQYSQYYGKSAASYYQEVWIGPNHLPLQDHSYLSGECPGTTIYSHYNQVDITPPAHSTPLRHDARGEIIWTPNQR
jgi:hypothetical protein